MSQSSKKKKKSNFGHKLAGFFIITGSVALVFAVIYVGIGFYFRGRFFPQTTINGVAVGGMNAQEAEAAIDGDAGKYTLKIIGRDGSSYELKGSEIGTIYVGDGSVGKALQEQKVLRWLPTFLMGDSVQVPTPMSFDRGRLEEAVAALGFFEESNVVHPEDASIQSQDGGYILVPEVAGNKLISDKVISAIGDAILRGSSELVFGDDLYENPGRTTSDPQLSATIDAINAYQNAKVTYDVPGEEEVLDAAKIAPMLKLGEDGTVSLDTEKVTGYVQSLASKYNTYGRRREFKTALGDMIEIGGGDYGWVVNKKKEAETLAANILAGEVVSRQPQWEQTAVLPGRADIGTTYIEIDYTNQHLYYFEDGNLVMDFDVVTGNVSKGNGSPDGVYKIVYKQSPAVLRGEDYESNVQYFMVFAYNVGVHDASWRTQFGGQYYKTAGSHGCVNAPGDMASQLYSKLKADTPVVAYYREPVTLTAENTRISNAFSYVKQ